MHSRCFGKQLFDSMLHKWWCIAIAIGLGILAGCSANGVPVVSYPTSISGTGGFPGGSSTAPGGTTVTETGKLKWSPFKISDANGGQMSIAEENGIIYINSSSQLLALSASDGKTIKWKYAPSFAGPGQNAPTLGGNAVYDLIFGEGLDAFNATTGHMLWTTNNTAQSTNIGDANSQPVYGGGFIFVHYDDGQTESLYAFAAQTGNLAWQKQLGPSQQFGGSGTTPAFADGVVYVLASNGTLYALSAQTGATQWSYATGIAFTSNTSYASPIVVQGMVLFGVYQNGAAANQSGGVAAISLTSHKPIWTQTISLGNNSSLAVVGNLVIVNGSQQTEAHALATGNLEWALQDETLFPYTVAGNAIYGEYSQFNGTGLIAFSSTGKQLWQFTPAFVNSNTFQETTGEIVVDQGTLYIGAYDNTAKQWGIYGYDISGYPSA